jgi:hypothetical protein
MDFMVGLTIVIIMLGVGVLSAICFNVLRRCR